MAYSFLEPIRVGKMVLKNRIIVPAMARYLCEDGFATEDYIRYYEAMAKGGVAMVTVGIMPIDLGWPSTMPSQPCLGDDKYIPQLQKAVTAMHAAGAKVSFQPWMPGRAPYTYADAVERAQDIAIVNKLTKDEILNILTVREALDLKAIDLIPEEDYPRLRDEMKACIAAVRKTDMTNEDMLRHDLEFHNIIRRAANNDILLNICITLTGTIYDERRVLFTHTNYVEQSLWEHNQIANAFGSLDVNQVKQAYIALLATPRSSIELTQPET